VQVCISSNSEALLPLLMSPPPPVSFSDKIQDVGSALEGMAAHVYGRNIDSTLIAIPAEAHTPRAAQHSCADRAELQIADWLCGL